MVIDWSPRLASVLKKCMMHEDIGSNYILALAQCTDDVKHMGILD